VKTPRTFTVKIKLGNAAMQTPEDVAQALAPVIQKLNNGWDTGKVMDANGNAVGEWGFK
jgi:hypothetical protein